MQKKELLDIAECMDTSSRSEKFYRFAHTYLSNMKKCGRSNTTEFFEMLKYCENNARLAAPRMGLAGKDIHLIKQWCQKIRQDRKLTSLTVEELDYVLSCCACKSKA